MSNVKIQEQTTGEIAKDCDCKDSSRREFFAKIGMGSLIVAAAGTGLFSYEYFSPNVLFESAPIIKAGKPDQFPANTVTLDAQSGIYLITTSPSGVLGAGRDQEWLAIPSSVSAQRLSPTSDTSAPHGAWSNPPSTKG